MDFPFSTFSMVMFVLTFGGWGIVMAIRSLFGI